MDKIQYFCLFPSVVFLKRTDLKIYPFSMILKQGMSIAVNDFVFEILVSRSSGGTGVVEEGTPNRGWGGGKQ